MVRMATRFSGPDLTLQLDVVHQGRRLHRDRQRCCKFFLVAHQKPQVVMMAATPFSINRFPAAMNSPIATNSPLTTGRASAPGTRSIRTGNGHEVGLPASPSGRSKVVSSMRMPKPAGGLGTCCADGDSGMVQIIR